ncbi:MAG: CoA-binding protein [Kineosporiaceae bacterium]
MPSRAAIEAFLERRSVAIVGVSRNPQDFTRSVHRAFREAGYRVSAVNAQAGEDDTVDGDPLVRTLGLVDQPVDAVLVMVPPAASAAVVQEALDRGVRHVWLHRGAGLGSVSDEAVAVARRGGAEVVDGACPLMFLGEPGLVHRVHRFLIRGRLTA